MTGTRALVRLILRRDRVILPIWVLLLAIMPVTQISAIGGLYSTDAELQSFAASMRATPAFFALYGPLLDWHVAALGVWRAGFVPVILGLAGLLTVIRHTRAEEESGRRELLGSTVLGRHAPLAAALIVVASANVIAGLIVAAPSPGRIRWPAHWRPGSTTPWSASPSPRSARWPPSSPRAPPGLG